MFINWCFAVLVRYMVNPYPCRLTKKHPHNPLAPYGKTKAIGEQIICDFVSNHRLQAISLRFLNPVGSHPSAGTGEFPRGMPSNLLPYPVQVAAGLHHHLRIWGDDYPTPDSTRIRDVIHVCDLAEVHESLGESHGPASRAIF